MTAAKCLAEREPGRRTYSSYFTLWMKYSKVTLFEYWWRHASVPRNPVRNPHLQRLQQFQTTLLELHGKFQCLPDLSPPKIALICFTYQRLLLLREWSKSFNTIYQITQAVFPRTNKLTFQVHT
jgi:hypothetical protein